DVMGAGEAVGGRRSLVEAPDLGAGPVGEGAGEDVVGRPALEDALLELGEGLFRVDGPESAHERRILGVAPALPPARGPPSDAAYAPIRWISRIAPRAERGAQAPPRIMQVPVACARSLPVSAATRRASAVACRRPRWTIHPSAR